MVDRHFEDETLIEVDQEILQKTGSGGFFSKGYLSEEPFVEYLQPDEEVLALLWSDRTAPEQQGQNAVSFDLDGYGALTAITSTRVLTVAGSSSGNQVFELELEDIETIRMGSSGRLRPEGWIRFETADNELIVYDCSGLDPETVSSRTLRASADARSQTIKQAVEQALALEKQKEFSEAKTKIETAHEVRKKFEAFQARYDMSIPAPKLVLDKHRERIQRRLEFDKQFRRAGRMEKDGELVAAKEAYKDAIEIGEASGNWNPSLDASAHVERVDFLKSQQEVESAIKDAESADGNAKRYRKYRVALDALEVHQTELSDLEFDPQCDGNICRICGATESLTEASVADLISEGEGEDDASPVPVCDRCATLDRQGLRWSQRDIDKKRTLLAEAMVNLWPGFDSNKYIDKSSDDENYSPHPAELQIAFEHAAKNLGRPPSTKEFTNLTGYGHEAIVGAFGNWGKALAAADLEIRSALVSEIEEFVEQTGLIPIPSKIIKNSRYPESVFDVSFGQPEALIKEAGYDVLGPELTRWQRGLRSLVDGQSNVPLRYQAKQTDGIDVSKLVSTYGSWEDVLIKAGIILDTADFEADVAGDIDALAETLGHTPSYSEYREYGSFENWEVRKAFGSFEEALSDLEFPERQVDQPDEAIDEPPDTSQDIPSHTTLLQELNWLQQRHGRQKARAQVEEFTVYDAKHFELQYGSYNEAFEILDGLTTAGSEYSPKQYMDEDLLELSELLERPPTLLDLLYYSNISLSKYAEKFDSLTALHEAAGYETDTTIPSNGELLSDLATVAETLGRPPTIDEYEIGGQYHFTTFVRRFDGWLTAVDAAEMDALSLSLDTVRRQEREVDRARFETQLRVSTGLGRPEVLIDELHRLVHEFNGKPTLMLIERYSRYPLSEFDSVFGSVETACNRAQLTNEKPVDIQPVDYEEQLIDGLSSLVAEFGHHPTQRLFDACGPSSTLSIITAFGNWRRALEATFDSPTPPQIAKPYLQSELESAIERLDDASQKNHSSIIQMLPEGCSIEDLDIMFESVSDAIDRAGGSAGDLRGPNSNTKEKKEREKQMDSTSEEKSSSGTDSAKCCDRMLDTLRSVYESVDRVPKRDDLDGTEFKMHDFVSTFGSWEAAIEEAGINKRSILLTELERIARELGDEPTTSDINDQSPYWGSTYSEYFGSWEEALEAASLPDFEDPGDEKSSTDNVSDGGTTTEPNRAELIEHLQLLDESNERLVRITDVREADKYSQYAYNEEFISFDVALKTAGIDKRAYLLDEFIHVWEQLGSPPTVSEITEHGDYSASMYYGLFDSWGEVKQAARAFASNQKDIEFNISGTDEDATNNDEPTETSPRTKEPGLNLTESDRTSSAGQGEKQEKSEPYSHDTQPNNDESRQALINELCRLDETVDGPLKPSHMRLEGNYQLQLYSSTFGSWNQAIEATDIDRDTQLLEEIERVAEKLGQPPSRFKMDTHGKVRSGTVANHFDSWEEALNKTNLDICSKSSQSRSSNGSKSRDDGSSIEKREQPSEPEETEDNGNDLRDQLRYKNKKTKYGK